jgi:hypothetical protein
VEIVLPTSPGILYVAPLKASEICSNVCWMQDGAHIPILFLDNVKFFNALKIACLY